LVVTAKQISLIGKRWHSKGKVVSCTELNYAQLEDFSQNSDNENFDIVSVNSIVKGLGIMDPNKCVDRQTWFPH
jgi:hypothetical protein